MVTYLFGSLLLLGVGITLFINIAPGFGWNPSAEQKALYDKSDNYVNGKFVNQVPTKMMSSAPDMFAILKDFISGGKNRYPVGQIPVSMIDWKKIKGEKDCLTWFGHSAFLVSIDNKKLLVDPILGPIASPVSFAGSKRYSGNMLHIIDEMPAIDAVFITHDHYDHLDYASILKLKNKVGHFFVPLGVSAHLIRWGVAKEKITELNWWDETEFQDLTVVFTPAKHFSGRGIFNHSTTLWGGWVILGKNTRLFTSGDGGYDAHFKEIGRKYGPFDIALIEGGQYDPHWTWGHMTPEQAVQANLDVNSKEMMLMHWGAFTLAFHSWTDPIERALEEAKKSGVNLIAPRIEETVLFDIDLNNSPFSWWSLN